MVNPPISSRVRTLGALVLGTVALAGIAPGQAHAGTSGSALIASAVVNIAKASECRTTLTETFTTTQVAGPAALVSRARTKPLSALEKMRMTQAGVAAASTTSAVPGESSTLASASGIAPAAVTGINCAQRFDAVHPGTSSSRFDFLESRILPVSSTAFDSAWNRVSAAPGGSAVRRALLQADAGEGAMADRIAKVNRWVNRAVAYTSDAKLYGQRDYWATAGETLARGKGDCEDFAIAKMEVLAAMGIAREDMFLTLARDLARRDDHAVLIVKVDGRAIMLDNATDELLDGDRANDYRPIMSFAASKRYLHGY